MPGLQIFNNQSVLVYETQNAQYHIDRANTIIIFRLPQKVSTACSMYIAIFMWLGIPNHKSE